MGLDFIRKKTAAYVQKRDSSRSMIDIPDLLERGNPDRIRECFSVQLRDLMTCIEPGYRVLIIFKSETEATVSQNGVVIGDLLPSDALEISGRLKASGKTSGMVQVLIREGKDISGCFKVSAVEPKDIPRK